MKAERNHARLYRSSDDVVIAGVCAGVADYLGLPSGKVRLATLLAVIVAAEQQVGRGMAQRPGRLADGGQRRPDEAGKIDIIEPRDR